MVTPEHGIRQALADRYQIERELGSGATATVYQAEDLKHRRQVAIKVLKPDLAATLAGERFIREIEIAAKLQHPHILPLLDSGQAAGTIYFVMPLVDGESLRDRLSREGPLPIGTAARILADVADAMAHAHARGIVHRDLKPDNVMLAGRHAVVMDFGVAKALNAAAPSDRSLTMGIAIGTPAYMAPEQATASPTVDHRADIYALGVIGYEVLTGRPPLAGRTPQEVLTAQVIVAPEPVRSRRPEIPAALAEIIDRCLAKAPSDRWQSAETILERLDPLATPGAGTTPAGLAPVGSRKRWLPWLAAVIGLAGIGAAVLDRIMRSRETGLLVAGSEQVTFVGAVEEIALAPDGQFLAYVTVEDTAHTLWVRDLRGPTSIRLASGPEITGITWTGDGGYVGYAIGDLERQVTRLVPRLGGVDRVLGQRRGLVAPDGKRFVVASPASADLFVIEPEHGDTIRLTRPTDERWVSGVAWGPASDRLVLTLTTPESLTGSVVILPLRGPSRVVVRDSAGLEAPSVSNDGRLIFYSRTGPSQSELMTVSVGEDGAITRRPTRVAGGIRIPQVPRLPLSHVIAPSPDGRSLYYLQETVWSNVARLTVGASPKREPRLYTMGTALYGHPRFSPDGRTIALVRATATGGVVGTVAVDGNTLSEIAPVRDPLAEVAWAPNGRKLAFTGPAVGSGLGLALYDLTSGLTRTVAAPVGMQLDWGPGGILVAAPDNRTFVWFDSTLTAKNRQLPADTMSWQFGARISPDGRWVALARNSSTEGQAMTVVSLEDSSRRTLVRGAGRLRPLGWTSDGSAVLVARYRAPRQPEELVLIPIDGAPPRPLLSLPAGYSAEDLSPDGHSLLVTQRESRVDVWRIDLSRR